MFTIPTNNNANIVSVNGTNVTSVDDFKADIISVDLSNIPADVWGYVTRELTQVVGLKGDERTQLMSLTNYDDSSTQTKLDTISNNLNSYNSTINTKLDSVPNDVWSVTTRELTVQTGLTITEHDQLFTLSNYDDSITQAKLDSLDSKMTESLNIAKGNWKIENDQMIFLDENDIEIMRFNLFDDLGNPSSEGVFRRERV